MTAQIVDKFDYLNNGYSIINLKNGELFEPRNYGFSPVALDTACWRGYYCKYSIENDYLTLFQLNIGLDIVSPPVWRGINASHRTKYNSYWMYEGVNLSIDYSGGIIIGRDLVNEFYSLFGFYQPHCYNHVCELIFEKGKLIKTVIYDEYMEQSREIIRTTRQAVKKSIGYYEDTQTVIIKVPNQINIKKFALFVKETASKYIDSTTIEIFNTLQSKGSIELDKKLYFWEYYELASCFEKNGYENIALTSYSTNLRMHLDIDLEIAQQPNLERLLKLYNKYNLGKILLL